MAGQHIPLSTLRRIFRDILRMTRGQRGLLDLRCWRLPLLTPCGSPRRTDRIISATGVTFNTVYVSGKCGRAGNHQLPAGKAQRTLALALIRDRYADFGPTLAREKIAAGLWVPRRDRPPKVYQPRNRRACLGELIQIDGSDHR